MNQRILARENGLVATRAATAVAVLILLAGCAAPGPEATPRWSMPDHPLHRFSVWVDAEDGGRGGGVIVHSSAVHGTYVLTAHHVVSRGPSNGAEARVGVFRHSLRDPGPGEPEFRRYPIDVVATRFLIDGSIDAAMVEVESALEELLRAAGDANGLPLLNRRIEDIRIARGAVERARTADEAGAALARIQQAFAGPDPEELGEEVGRAAALAAAAVGAERATDLANRVFAATREMADAVSRWRRGGFRFHDAALVRLRTDRLFHAAVPADRPPANGERVEIATVWPEGEPLVRTLRMSGSAKRPDETEFVGLVRGGNSGSPVFHANRLVGIAVRGRVDSDPDEETYGSGTFVSIAAIRTWLANRGLDRLLLDPEVFAAPRADVLGRVAVMGASAAAGHGTRREVGGGASDVPLSALVRAMIRSEAARVLDASDELFLVAPESTGEELVEEARESDPTCVIALDFLFWYAYGNQPSLEARQERLAKGLRLLEGFRCPVLVSGLPPARRARGGKPILPREMLDALNGTIEAWARERGNVLLVPLEETLAALRTGRTVRVAGGLWEPPGALAELLQPDELHPTVTGLGFMAGLCMETLIEKGYVARGGVEPDARAAAAAVLRAATEGED